ncbi:MAG TPA: efflux RND transporter permease subunit [Deltaproteobacteria bacterium]|nr:efflux RND transporter permease subunit [Deltaproteobacteria bacterium]HPR56002.1 efflux RND transporter permease subunit [Deltaproteobacteria bacterium]HXK48381.1 efflux RND transporter permease subunit [Deltaproteobacteria bacterium]
MKFTDIFIRRPVLSTVVSMLILVLGLRSINLLPVREYPETQNAVVTVTTVYTGADPALVSGFITTPLENSIAQANGIDYLTSSSSASVSTITANLRLNYDANKALTEINTKVNAVLNQLPEEAQQPVIGLSTGEDIGSMIMGFYSKDLPTNKITDYLIRVVQPKLQAVEGVQTAEILGKQEFALRAWLDPERMAAHNVTATDVSSALAANDFISALGRTKGQMVSVDLTAATGMHSVDEFRNLVIRSDGAAIVRLGDVANVTLGAENYDSAVRFDGKTAVFMSIKVAPNANLLAVADGVRKVFPAIAGQLPQGLDGRIVYDATDYVNSSIREVVTTLVEALLIVTLVIFLSLGSVRSVIIPTIAIPLSLVGAFFIMLALGYTINLMTLLALVLAIGLVVDDAIIVVENVHRHMEEGASLMQAAIQGARELGGPIVAMTVVLIAVYVPIGFMGGLTGALFTEFAYTLAGAVVVSAVIALTLSPMMCSRFLRHAGPGERHRFTDFIDGQFNLLRSGYERLLRGSLNMLPVVGVFAAIILASNYFLFAGSNSELAPQEDQGFLIAMLTAAPDATLEQTQLYSRQFADIIAPTPEIEHLFQVEGFFGLNSGFAGLVLKPWDERERTSNELQPEIQTKLGQIAGARAVAFQPAPLPGTGHGLPVQFVIGTTDSFERLNEVSRAFLDKATASGMFMYVDSDLKIDKPQTVVEFDRDKAAQLGLTMADVGSSLASMLGGGYVNYFSLSGRSYKVIPQVMQSERLTADQILDYHIRTAAGDSIPVSTIARLKTTVVPESINHFQQLNSATVSAVLTPGISLGQALESLRAIADEVLPQGYSVDYGGESRQFVQESTALLFTFAFALVIIFLALAALFESFRDPVIVLISVPMSICGALIFISLGVGGASLNIYTEVGLVTLIGLISKHGILIVQFANDLQRQGKSKREAVEQASAVRFRPILMTTAAMVLGVMPLVFASGAGAAGRYNMGLVITTGIAIGTLFTLFVVPAMYMFLATDHARQRDREQATAGEAVV